MSQADLFSTVYGFIVKTSKNTPKGASELIRFTIGTDIYMDREIFHIDINMNRDVITDLVFANLLDLIPLITNTDEDLDPAILRIYKRTAGIFEEI